MKTQLFFAACALSAALAQAQGGVKKAADPDQAVPRSEYRSVFVNTPGGVESDRMDWRVANDQVARFKRGHVDILKQEEAEGASSGRSGANPVTAPKPSADASAVRPVAAPAAQPAHRH